MKVFRTLALSGILLAPAAHALAADVVLTEPAPAVAPEDSVYTWSGPYAGGFVGYNFAHVDQSGGAKFDGEGVVGGVYAGYSLQTGSLVYGAEADVGASDLTAGGFSVATGVPISADSTAFGSLRALVGVDYDPIMLFATGGVAVANKELSLGNVSDDKTHVGYTVGAGVQAKVTKSVTSRVEYRYSDFESKDYDLGNVTVSSGFDEHSIRAGLALKF
ncbi:porin family protein [Aureimonas flava]|uniref:Porin family protein n=1 Tax=Aureimonas flava TaxID=2320271 RepID=A0A3A1WR80_9HYPH|nr:outer membrane protein [Aureimonas flava]RIY03546.1 porin family protein [Aureimonas flava]